MFITILVAKLAIAAHAVNLMAKPSPALSRFTEEDLPVIHPQKNQSTVHRSASDIEHKLLPAEAKHQAIVDFSDDTDFAPEGFKRQLTPVQFIFMSSPSRAKVSYAELRNFRSVMGKTHSLIDEGLRRPCGLAFDRWRGSLYVADQRQRKIYRYTIVAKRNHESSKDEGLYRLRASGPPITILLDHEVDWITVDRSGAIYFSERSANTVSKIPGEVVDEIASGRIAAEVLNRIPNAQSAMYAEASFRIEPLYRGHKGFNRVNHPSGLAVDGMRLYWANMANGTGSGTVVEGLSSKPELSVRATEQRTAVLAENTDTAHGLTSTHSMLLFSGQTGGYGTIFGVRKFGGKVSPYVTDLGQPRGLVWDGDNTVFVADQQRNGIWSFPAGRPNHEAPLTKTVDFPDAYGLALVFKTDPGFQMMIDSAGVHQASIMHWLMVALLAPFFTSSVGVV